EDVIDDADVRDEVAETQNTVEVKDEHVIVHTNFPNQQPDEQHDIVDDDVSMTPITRNKKHCIKINARNRLYRVLDEDKDEDEAEDENPW
ncbi:hypothetical protein Tco_0689234, partial [Tanacetum coccineum]